MLFWGNTPGFRDGWDFYLILVEHRVYQRPVWAVPVVFLTGTLLTCCRYCWAFSIFQQEQLRAVRGSKLFSRLYRVCADSLASSEVTGPIFSISLENEGGDGWMVECVTALVFWGPEWICLNVFLWYLKALKCCWQVVQLMNKEMELYELGVVFIFKGVLGVCVYNLIMFLPASR